MTGTRNERRKMRLIQQQSNGGMICGLARSASAAFASGATYG
jgi:hypothetical protein